MAGKRKSGEGSYDKIDGFYVWSRRVGNRRFVVKRRDYTEFRSEVAKRQAEIQRLKVANPPRDVTVEQFLPEWIEEFVSPPKLSRGTHRSYLGGYANQIAPYLGSQKLSRLKTTDVQAWINQLGRDGVGGRTVQIAFVVLKRSLDAAVNQGYIGRNPCEGCALPRLTTKPMRVMSPDDMSLFLQAAFQRPHVHRRDALNPRQASRYRQLFRFALGTGLRIGELLGLQRHHCDLESGLIRVEQQLEWDKIDGWDLVPPKTKSSIRTIVLEPSVVRALRQQLAMVDRERARIEDYEDYGLVFPTLRGTPSHPRNIRRQLDSCLTKADLERYGLHDLRRTCLTNLANRGLPMHQLKAYAGHTSITTTAKYYVGVSLEAMRASLDALKPLSATVKGFGTKATRKATKSPELPQKGGKKGEKNPKSGSKDGCRSRTRTYDPLINRGHLARLWSSFVVYFRFNSLGVLSTKVSGNL